MGHNSIPCVPIRRAMTNLDHLRERYVKDDLTLEEFEQEVGVLISRGQLDRSCPTNDYQIFSQFPSPMMAEILG